jgi:hypothetical protein
MKRRDPAADETVPGPPRARRREERPPSPWRPRGRRRLLLGAAGGRPASVPRRRRRGGSRPAARPCGEAAWGSGDGASLSLSRCGGGWGAGG